MVSRRSAENIMEYIEAQSAVPGQTMQGAYKSRRPDRREEVHA